MRALPSACQQVQQVAQACHRPSVRCVYAYAPAQHKRRCRKGGKPGGVASPIHRAPADRGVPVKTREPRNQRIPAPSCLQLRAGPKRQRVCLQSAASGSYNDPRRCRPAPRRHVIPAAVKPPPPGTLATTSGLCGSREEGAVRGVVEVVWANPHPCRWGTKRSSEVLLTSIRHTRRQTPVSFVHSATSQ